MNVFQCQTNLYKPIQDLHTKAADSTIITPVSVRPEANMILQDKSSGSAATVSRCV